MRKKLLFQAIVFWNLVCSSTAYAFSEHGFLTRLTAPDSLIILPPPPAENSVLFQSDKAQYESGRVIRNASRNKIAAMDSDYKDFGRAFSQAFGMEISRAHTPILYKLLKGILQDSHDFAMRGAKEYYKRVRPYVFYKDASCTPEKDRKMSTTGSYPSGHASFGWAVALILAEINSARETEIIRRGYDFGQSRVICGAHWQTDVDSGRLMGASVVAALHANSEFSNVLSEAKKEFSMLNSQDSHK